MTTQTEITQRNHRRAVRFFWWFLISAIAVSWGVCPLTVGGHTDAVIYVN